VISRQCASELWASQPLPEKPKACAKPPKPPRLTLLELASDDEAPDDERPEESLLLKNPKRDDEWYPLDPPCDVQLVPFGCGTAGGAVVPADAGAAIAGEGGVGVQVWRGISTEAKPPTANVPISSSATCEERLRGGSAGGAGGCGRRLPNSLVG
jgi:hypothetical protein